MATTSENVTDKDICHVYGDPHVIRFSQQPKVLQNQYWCKISGVHRILKNEYIEIIVLIPRRTWLIDEFIIMFFKDNETLCTINNNEQRCDSPEFKVTRPSLSQVDILYLTPRIHISIVPHQYELQWYDISVRMTYELIQRSSGLCIIPSSEICEIENSIEQEKNNINPLSKSICMQYLAASIQASNELGLFNDPDRYNNALIACIHDYQTTGNKNFGASIVHMIIKYGIHRQQLEDLEFDLQTNKSMSIISNAVINANIQADILLAMTTQTSVKDTTTDGKLSSTSNVITSTSTIRTTTESTADRCYFCSICPQPFRPDGDYVSTTASATGWCVTKSTTNESDSTYELGVAYEGLCHNVGCLWTEADGVLEWALCLIGLINSIFGYSSRTGTNETNLGVQLGQSIISIAFYIFGIIVAYRYSQIGLRVFAWLGIVSLIGLGIIVVVLLLFSILAVTAGSVANDGVNTALMIGASTAALILVFVIIFAFILTKSKNKF
ncbi:unnamed protein product [Rotaria sp. Silwood1]|nr:unnamed protein product [Rotaria sp. Silwood1]